MGVTSSIAPSLNNNNQATPVDSIIPNEPIQNQNDRGTNDTAA